MSHLLIDAGTAEALLRKMSVKLPETTVSVTETYSETLSLDEDELALLEKHVTRSLPMTNV